MNNLEVNQALAAGDVGTPGVLPKIDILRQQLAILEIDFGLKQLPTEPGLLLIRGARQYGKSTWLQQQIRQTIITFGPGSAFYINGDEIRNQDELEHVLLMLNSLFSPKTAVRRIFVDEITAIKHWELSLKRLLDRNALPGVLLITTGSKATDLRHGAERLPGRKGKLNRTQYLFTPMSFRAFEAACWKHVPETDILPAYLISGGSPPATLSLLEHGVIAPYVVEIVRDWIYGEFSSAGRSRDLLLGVLQCLYRFGGSPTGYAKIAREAGMANNTVASGYIDQLADLLCVAPSLAWDASAQRPNRRRPCKFHFINMLVAIAWHPFHIRRPADFHDLPDHEQGILLEWAVAQECWRKAALRGDEIPEKMFFWKSDTHELDFIQPPEHAIEVKRGRSGPLDFGWFAKTYPKTRLTVVSASRFETDQIQGITLRDFLLNDA